MSGHQTRDHRQKECIATPPTADTISSAARAPTLIRAERSLSDGQKTTREGTRIPSLRRSVCRRCRHAAGSDGIRRRKKTTARRPGRRLPEAKHPRSAVALPSLPAGSVCRLPAGFCCCAAGLPLRRNRWLRNCPAGELAFPAGSCYNHAIPIPTAGRSMTDADRGENRDLP